MQFILCIATHPSFLSHLVIASQCVKYYRHELAVDQALPLLHFLPNRVPGNLYIASVYVAIYHVICSIYAALQLVPALHQMTMWTETYITMGMLSRKE